MNPLIIALDFDSTDEAWRLVEMLGEQAEFYKVGLELYAAGGLDFVRRLQQAGKRVFLDLKLHDIGETVKRATRLISRTSAANFLTVHASVPVMRAAAEGRDSTGTQLLAVTVLTNFDDQDLAADGYSVGVSDLVAMRVRQAIELGMDGVICSPLELRRAREIAGDRLKLVVPGVRSQHASPGDQKRTATPAEAIRNGADHLVIGRQVTRAADPAAAYRSILAEIAI